MLVWLALALVFVVLLGLIWGTALQGWGAPRPYWSRRRRRLPSYGSVPSPLDEEAVETRPGVDPLVEPEDEGWGVLADVLWVLAIVALAIFLVDLLTT